MSKFNDNEMFCKRCMLSDHFWSGGNSWGIDHCPNCEQKDGIIWHETILWECMNLEQRRKATGLYNEWWKKFRTNLVKQAIGEPLKTLRDRQQRPPCSFVTGAVF